MNWKTVWGWFVDRAQPFMVFARSMLALAIGFKWVELTVEQIGLVIAAMENFFGWVTAKGTVPTSRIPTIVDKEIASQISTGQISTGSGDLVTQSGKTGTGG